MTVEVAPEIPWRRLSRRMLFVHPVHELLRFLPLIVIFVVFGRGDVSNAPYGLIAAAAAVLLGVMRWLTTEYRVTPDQVQIRSGLLERKISSVARDRVRAVDVTARVMHRLLGLAVVTIGTGRQAGQNDDALRLDGLTVEETARLRGELLDRTAGEEAAAPATPGQVLARWRTSWVRYGPFSFSGFVTLGVLAGGAAQGLNELGPVDTDDVHLPHVVEQLADLGIGAVVTVAAVALVLAATMLATAGYFIAHFRFTLSREANGTLHVSRGLLTTRATTLEERRLRGVELDLPLPLRLVRGARLTAIATGADAGATALLLPPAPAAEARETAVRVLGDDAPVTGALLEHPPAAIRRRWTRALGPAAVLVAAALVAGAAGIVSWPLAAAVAAVLLAGGAALALDRIRALGHAIAGRWLVAQSGSIRRTRAILERDGVIGVNVRSSYFQRRAGVCTFTATTAGGREGYAVLDVDEATAIGLAEETVPGLLTPFLRA